MRDEYLFLWAQWGILKAEYCKLLLKHYGDFEEAWKKVTPEFLLSLGMGNEKVKRAFEIRKRLSFESIMDTVKHFNIKLYYWEDEEYPALLKELETAPPFIWVRGQLPSFHKSMAVVGTRAYSSYGKVSAEKFTADLTREGFVVVSGLALGIDSIAHKTCIDGNGITVAVLGTGVDQIYPSANHRLAQDILQAGGAIISAYPLGTKGMPHHFPARNLIVAGLTKGTLVIEGGMNSGALITARLALESNREVFAVPNDITKLALSGTNDLIRNSKAKLVENIDHILEDLGMKGDVMRKIQDFEPDELVILERLSSGSKTMNELCNETEFDIPRLSALLIHLVLKDAVTEEGGGWILI